MKEALKSDLAEEWKRAADVEYQSLIKNDWVFKARRWCFKLNEEEMARYWWQKIMLKNMEWTIMKPFHL